MNSIFNRLDEIEETVMDELKDFQRATVERIDYLYRHGQNRILVSDEVGLGKTLVARGTIAKFAKLRRDEGDNLVKVVYICSNATIAEQNLDKLRIVNELRPENTHSSRLSMQHLNIFNQENDQNVLNRYIQLIPLTPETSFKVSNSQGTMNERALMLAILRRLPTFRQWQKQLNEIFRFGVHYWEGSKNYYENQVNLCNEKSDGEYLKYMTKEVTKQLSEIRFGEKNLLLSLKDLCRKIKKEGLVKREAKPFIVRLRIMFADISLNKLEPDLIIMDEFQRFKYLLSSDRNSEMDRLVNKFFNSEDMRILMLSATPYKMYSTLDEIDEDQIDAHYSEFFNVMDFLNVCKRERIKFKEIWNNYSIELKEFDNNKDSFILAKTKAENAMFKSICRTERITESEVVDIVDDSDAKSSLNVSKDDILSFIEAQKLLDEIGLNNNVPIDYIKSSPYLMSFMKNYQLKRRIERHFKNNTKDIPKMKKSTFWLNENNINNYREISPNNARLNDLMNHVLKDNAEKLLWVPPAQPYYSCEGVFEGVEDFSKTLIFSSWEMVPRMISSMVSYEVERKTIAQLKNKNHDIKYFAKNRYPSPRLNFNLNEDKPAQMSLFSLIYPSLFLIDIYNPIDCLNRKLSLKEIEYEIKSKIMEELDKIPSNENSREDARWYYLAPLLFDNHYSQDYINNWFEGINQFINEGIFYQKGFLKHFELLKNQFNECTSNHIELGRKPDDLVEVLCDLTIASPAICIYRAYKKEAVVKKLTLDVLFKEGLIDNSLAEKGLTIDDFIDRNLIEKKLAKKFLSKNYLVKKGLIDKDLAEKGISRKDLYKKESIVHFSGFATQVARRFLNRMNTPESIAVIDLIFKQDSEDAYWKNLLKYSKQGNLQAMLDEYVHLLSNGLDENNEDRIPIINHKLLSSMEIRAASYDFDTYKSFSSRMKGRNNSSPSLRTHFAVAFTKGKSDERDTNRKKTVRDAFNSPFRPFVLASTSIGQEGLDFHNYCRRIVHWNLPSNPIDLEQREGRINRFECLAIRQNVARRYGDCNFESDDIWQELFEEASKREKVGGCSDLIPYWGLKDSNDMVKIERIVPMFPFSKDELRYDRLIKILSLYRLTLGQSRQEQILENIFNNWDGEDNLSMDDVKDLFINLSPYYKENVEDFEIDCEDIEDDIPDDENENNEDLNESVDGEINNQEDTIYEISNNLNDLNKKFIFSLTPNIWQNNIRSYNEANLITENVNDICDVREYWKNVKCKIIENNLFDGHFIKFNDRIYWMPIDDIPLNLARIEMLIHNGFIEVKIFISWCDALYHSLKNRLESIEKDLGFKLSWDSSSHPKNISIFNLIDMNRKDLWDDAIKWHVSIAKRIYDVFSPLMKDFCLVNPNVLDFDDLRAYYWKELDYRLDKSNLLNMDVHHPWVGYSFILNNFGWSDVRFILNAYKNRYQFRICLACNKDIYDFIIAQKSEIEDELGFNLIWKRKKGFSDIYIIHRGNVKNKNEWEDALIWQVSNVEKFKKVFIPKINEFYNR